MLELSVLEELYSMEIGNYKIENSNDWNVLEELYSMEIPLGLLLPP